MFRAFIFLIKVLLLAAFVAWAARHPGWVQFEWMDVVVRVQMGLFVALAVAVILMSIFVFQVMKAFSDFPKSLRRYHEVRAQEKGYRALTIGLAAVAAGDTKVAVAQAQRAQKYLDPANNNNPHGLSLLLQAQAARLDGREAEAQKYLQDLMQDKDAGFLGVRGLLQTAMDQGDDDLALNLAEKALGLYPRQKWILCSVYALQLRLKNWSKSAKTLKKIEKINALPAEHVRRDRIAFLHLEAQKFVESDPAAALKFIEKAYRLDADFTPSVVQLARLCGELGKRRRAVNVVQKAWKAEPRLDLAAVWDGLIPKAQKSKVMGRLHWFEKLAALCPDHAESLFALGRVCLEEGLWGEARGHFLKALERFEAPPARLYDLLAQIEEKQKGDAEAAQKWRLLGASAAPEKAWVCTETGRVYESWSPVAEPQGRFNTIRWMRPDDVFSAGGVIEAMGSRLPEAL